MLREAGDVPAQAWPKIPGFGFALGYKASQNQPPRDTYMVIVLVVLSVCARNTYKESIMTTSGLR